MARRFLLEKRPMLIITLSYIIGILLGLYLEINITLYICVLIVIIIIMYYIFWKLCGKVTNYSCISRVIDKLICKTDIKESSYKIGKRVKLVSICCLVIIISNTIIHQKELRYRNLYNVIGEDVNYVGVVMNEEKESSYYYNYIIQVKSLNSEQNNKFKNTNILLKIKKNKNSNVKKLEYGDLIYGIGNFEKPATRRNYMGYDYLQYLKNKNVYMICNSNITDVKVIKKNSHHAINMWINKLRNRLKNNLIQLLPDTNAGIAIALLLGDTSLIDEKQKNVFSNASLSHILAISGMHVTYVIIGCSFLLKKFDKRKSKYFFIVFLIFFAQLTGGSPSVIRAVIMTSLMIISKLVYRKSDTINNLCIACLAILIINPYNILNLGFQLSFLGTLGIVLFNSKLNNFSVKMFAGTKFKLQLLCNKLNNPTYSKLNAILKKIKSILILSISANILICPIILYNFNSLSLTFLISNLIVTPIIGLMCFMGYATLIFSTFSIKISKISAFLFNICILTFNKMAEIAANTTLLRFLIVTPSIAFIVIYYLMIFYLAFIHRKKYNKIFIKVVAISSVIVIVFNLIKINNSGLKLYFIDVGQGDSTLIVTSTNKTILIDGGGSETGNYDVGEKVLLPYLLDRKIKTIDYMIFSHFDADHCKGLFTVMENLKVKTAIISNQGEISDNYKQFLQLVKEKNINVVSVKARK